MSHDQPGFLHSLLIDNEGGCRLIDAQAVAGWRAGSGTLWVHLDVDDAGAQQWLTQESGIESEVTDALLAGETRPRSFNTSQGLLIVLRAVNTNPGQDPEDMVSLRIWVEENRVISTQRRPLLAIKDVASSLAAGRGPGSSGTLLVAIIEGVAFRIGAFVDQIEDRLSDMEDRLATADHATFRKELSEVRRQTAAVRRFLAPQRDALDRMYRQPGRWIRDDDATNLREEADRITRYLEDLDLARERTIVLQEEFLGEIAQQQNARMYVLSVVAAVFLPLSFATGLLGMNVGGLPGIENPMGFWWSVLVMLGIGLGLFFFFKRKRWI